MLNAILHIIPEHIRMKAHTENRERRNTIQMMHRSASATANRKEKDNVIFIYPKHVTLM